MGYFGERFEEVVKSFSGIEVTTTSIVYRVSYSYALPFVVVVVVAVHNFHFLPLSRGFFVSKSFRCLYQ